MASADLKLASEALQGLKSNPEALKNYDLALTALRHDLHAPLDEATFAYVINAINNQRVFGGVDPVRGDRTLLPGGFQIISAVKVEA